ncbi:MAG: diaminopimelate epimerase [Holophagales bacterium]|nr:diaminopimelate epimerase [Holophagales bacterium]MYH24332.1 diaminopimelate epimerase [Holophagales bacterium]
MSDQDGTPFLLVSGAGNDFIALIERPAPAAGTIQAWCRRGVSVGADGLFTLHRIAEERYALDYANADGARAALCLNAARCAARLAFDQEPDARSLTIETGAGDLIAEPVDDTCTAVRVPAPTAGRRMTLRANGRDVPGWRIDAGVPHFVLWWSGDLDEAPVESLGPVLRAHPDLGPEGANVHFVDLDPLGRFRIRSFERGVEAETLACGTGVVAAAACGIAEGRLSLPIAAVTRSGFELRLEAAPDGPDGHGRWRLSGDARIVARGRIAAAASA